MHSRFYPDNMDAFTEADIERAARVIAKVYIIGFRSQRPPSCGPLTTEDEWVELNWESFCGEACEALAPTINKTIPAQT